MKHYFTYYGVFTLILLLGSAALGLLMNASNRFFRIIFIMAFLMLISICINAQEKAKTPLPAKPTFEQSIKTTDIIPFAISGNFDAQQTNDYLVFESAGDAQLSRAPNISAQEYTRMKENHQLVADSIKNRLGRQIRLWYDKKREQFTADTLKLYHSKK